MRNPDPTSRRELRRRIEELENLLRLERDWREDASDLIESACPSAMLWDGDGCLADRGDELDALRKALEGNDGE